MPLTTPPSGQAVGAGRRLDAQGSGAAPRATVASKAETATTDLVQRGSVSREAPFGAERPRYQRPGSILDIKV